MDISSLQTFVRVVEYHSFSKAAEMERITQPAVSQRIKALEKEFGTVLLERADNRKVSLTAGGRLAYRYARTVMALWRNVRREIDELAGLVRGTLTVGASTGSADYFLIPVLARFRRRYPLINIALELDVSRQIVTQVRDADLEVGVCGARSREAGLEFLPIRKDHLVVVVAPEHPWSVRGSVAVDELLAEDFIGQQYGSGARDFLEQQLQRYGVSPTDLRLVMEVGTQESVKRAVEANLGVSVLSSMAVERECSAGTLKKLDLEKADFTRQFYVVWKKDRHLSAASEAFIEFLRRENASE